MGSKEELTRTILRVIAETGEAKGVDLSGVTLESPVDSRLGLDSLDWAAIVVRLEMETGIDPFAAGMAGQLTSVSDIVDLYGRASR